MRQQRYTKESVSEKKQLMLGETFSYINNHNYKELESFKDNVKFYYCEYDTDIFNNIPEPQ